MNTPRPSSTTLNRKTLLKHGLFATAGAAFFSASAAENPAAVLPAGEAIRLREKFPGCIAGCHIGSAMNPQTNSQRALRETADGLFPAFQARLQRMKRFVDQMEAV